MMEQNLKEKIFQETRDLRQELHRYPELSGNEKETIKKLKKFFHKLNPDQFSENIGSNSVAWTFQPENPVKTIMFRADMDALPIPDEIEAPYKSDFENVGHKCGHDGHMAILSGFAELLSRNRPKNTRVVLLFQAEEETGQGAEKVVNDSWFGKINPDYVFGLHNLPGFKKHTVILRQNIFASASVGIKIKLKGKSAHAGQPQDGISPAMGIARLSTFIQKELDYAKFEKFCLATIIHIRLGEVAFGTSPGEADFMLTLRAAKEEELELLTEMINEKTRVICKEENLKFEVSFTERFPSTVNHEEAVNLISSSAESLSLDTTFPVEPFRWSEDFGHYLKNNKGAFFGLGAGKEAPALHNPDYDFPDEILMTGVKLFFEIYSRIDKNGR
ncbi:MAG: amidohydrolase [Bacteroidales bacterium]